MFVESACQIVKVESVKEGEKKSVASTLLFKIQNKERLSLT